MERYRSGHNGPDSKSGVRQRTVGSNPTRSAQIGKAPAEMQVLFQFTRSWVGSLRSLNLRTAALERRLYLFRANKRRSLAFGTPHRGVTPFVCPLRFLHPYPNPLRVRIFIALRLFGALRTGQHSDMIASTDVKKIRSLHNI